MPQERSLSIQMDFEFKTNEELHDLLCEASQDILRLQDQVSEMIERETQFARYLRGPFTFL